MIIPSKEVLLIMAAEAKQLFMFDAKTGCVLYKYGTESVLAASAGYYESAQQLILPHLNNTYVNIWDTDSQEAKKFSVGEGEKICALLIYENCFALMGSANGSLYVYELPSGIIIRKVSIHSSAIQKLILLKSGYLISCLQNQLKLWMMAEFLYQKKTPIPQKTVHSSSPILDIAQTRQLLLLATQNTLKFYHSQTLQQYDREFPTLHKFTNITCICASRTGFYVGNAHGKIKYVNLDSNYRQFQYEKREGKGIQMLKYDAEGEIDARDPVTCLVFMDSLGLLVAGNCKGEIKIWENNKLKNSMHLFKSSISFLFAFPKPNKSTKIPHNSKIKALHKQQLTKLEQPIVIYSEIKQTAPPKTDNQYLYTMLETLNNPTQLLRTQIATLKQQNQQLIKANLHYQSYFQNGGSQQ